MMSASFTDEIRIGHVVADAHPLEDAPEFGGALDGGARHAVHPRALTSCVVTFGTRWRRVAGSGA